MTKRQHAVSQAFRQIPPVPSVRRLRPLGTRAGRRRRATMALVEALEVRTLLSSASAQLIADINAVPSYPSDLTPAGSNLFYLVEDSTDSGLDLEVTNSGGTHLLMDFPGGSTSTTGAPSQLTAAGNDLYFTTNGSGTDELWTSDGTTGGTVQVTVDPSITSLGLLLTVGSTLVFSTQSDQSSTTDYQLWAIAPGSSAPAMLADLQGSSPLTIDAVGSTLYLSVGGNLWTTDGTAAHTKEVLQSGNPIAAPSNVFGFNGKTYDLDNSQGQTTLGVLGSSGQAPIVSLSTTITVPVVVGSTFYFTAEGAGSQGDSQLWSSDGTAAGTHMVEDLGTGSTARSRPTSSTPMGRSSSRSPGVTG